MKYLFFLFLLIPNVVQAQPEKHVLFFTGSSWCPKCPDAAKMLEDPSIVGWIKTYDDNAIIDIPRQTDDSLESQIRLRLGVKYVPQVLVVQVDSEDDEYKEVEVLETWGLDNSRDKGKGRLKYMLYKLSPKYYKPNGPLRNLLK